MRALAVILLSLFLAGCYVSKTPLVTVEQAAFPFQKIVYSELDSEEQFTLTKSDKGYVYENQQATLLFKSVGENLYVAQVEATQDGETQYLFSVLKVDAAAKTATAYKSISEGDPKIAGLALCAPDGDEVCVENLDAYVDLAKKAIAANEEPDAVYNLVTTE